MFNGIHYVIWKVRMKTYIQSLGADVCDAMEEEYKKPTSLITRYHKMDFTCNTKNMNSLLVVHIE